MQIPSFAVQPGAVRRLRRSIVAVGGSGVAVVVLSTFGGGIMDTAASAALSGGGAYGSGGSQDDAVSGMAASAPVEIGELTDVGPIEGSALYGAVGEAEAAPAVPAAVVVEVAAVAAPPVAIPRAQPAPPPAPGTVQAIIAEVFGPHASAATGVARCESGLNPGAISRGGGNWGLFQINKVHARRVANMGYAWEDLLDARVNSIVAKSIFDESGWGPWACRHAAR